MKVEPKEEADRAAFLGALGDLCRDDQDLSFTVDAESGEVVLGGFGELHLDIAVDGLKQRGIAASVGASRIVYREVLISAAEIEYTYRPFIGQKPDFARVLLNLEPNVPEGGNTFSSALAEEAAPMDYIKAIEKGVRSVWERGVLIGSPLFDVKVTLLDGAYHTADLSVTAFEFAARQAIRDGYKKRRHTHSRADHGCRGGDAIRMSAHHHWPHILHSGKGSS
jgi:elongation factor G